jgi:ketosteroid isomerase-like protein
VRNSQDRLAAETSIETAEIARTTASLLDAINASDLAGVLAMWSDDGALMPPQHPSVHGRTEIERFFSRLFQQPGSHFSFTFSQIHVSGDVAFERLEYAASVRSGQEESEVRDIGKGPHVYRRQPNESWKLAMDIWNSDTPATVAE